MDSDAIKSAKDKLMEINKIVSKLDPAIRGPAFEILAPLFFKEGEVPSGKGGKGAKKTGAPVSTADKETFFSSFEHDKPKDNVVLIVAWLYSQHGVFAITKALLDEEASDAGLTIPDRSDNTMRYGKAKGKNLFRQRGKGWQLTVSGETYLTKTYRVKKGNKPPPQEESE